MNARRGFLLQSLSLAALGALPLAGVRAAGAAAPWRAVVSVPGPGNLLYLPVPLASKIGADRAEGLELDIRYTGGGPQAMRSMLERNSDFSCAGLSAAALQRINGQPVVCIAPFTRVPAYTLLVSTRLRGKVRTVADLRGRVIGVKGHVPGGRSTSQLFAEYLLAQSGLQPDQVNYVAAGQSYDSQYAALASSTVDAIVADEPFATRLIRQHAAFALADFHDLETTRKMLGGLFLNSMLATRDDVIAQQPELAEKMVLALRRTLVWISSHSAQDMVEVLAPTDGEERRTLLEVLQRRKNIYSPDGRISAEQLATVERFVHATEKTPTAQAFRIRSVVDARWAGSAA